MLRTWQKHQTSPKQIFDTWVLLPPSLLSSTPTPAGFQLKTIPKRFCITNTISSEKVTSLVLVVSNCKDERDIYATQHTSDKMPTENPDPPTLLSRANSNQIEPPAPYMRLRYTVLVRKKRFSISLKTRKWLRAKVSGKRARTVELARLTSPCWCFQEDFPRLRVLVTDVNDDMCDTALRRRLHHLTLWNYPFRDGQKWLCWSLRFRSYVNRDSLERKKPNIKRNSNDSKEFFKAW